MKTHFQKGNDTLPDFTFKIEFQVTECFIFDENIIGALKISNKVMVLNKIIFISTNIAIAASIKLFLLLPI